MQHPKRALTALVYLFRPYNDIDIYIEDTTCRNMYEILIERILNGRAELRRIFPLGGRPAVISRCSLDQTDAQRRRLYLIDGDFDALFGNKVAPDLKHLYQLGVYCAENILFCEHAVCELGCECMTNTFKQEIEEAIDFRNFLLNLVSNLRPLLILYGAAYMLEPSLQTFSYNATNLVQQTGKHVELSRTKTKARCRTLLSELQSSHSMDEIRNAVKYVRSLIPPQEDKVINLISGKTYLLPLLNFHLRSKVKFGEDLDRLKVRLARHSLLDKDPGLISAIEKTSRGQSL